jgi:WD40 repeat protein
LPLVLCYLQDLSYEEAARLAGCSPGALRGRLERGKRILRRRLARYGLPLAASVLVLGRPAAVSAALGRATVATVKAGLSGGTVPVAVAALAGSTIPLKVKTMCLAGVLLAVVGVAWASQGEPYVEPKTKEAPKAAAETQPASPPKRGMDTHGDPLPPGAVARFGTRRFQVAGWPVSALGGRAHLVYQSGFRWLDAATGKVLDTWEGPHGPLIDVETGRPAQGTNSAQTLMSLSPDGRWGVFTDPRALFTGIRVRQEKPDRSFALYVYDLTARKKVQELRWQTDEANPPVTSASVSADGKWLAAPGNWVRLWDVAAGKQVWASKPAGQNFEVLGFTPGGKHLVLCGSKDSAIVLVDTAGAKVVRTIATNLSDRRGTLLAPDGSAVLMRVASTPQIVVWDVNAGKQLPSLDDPDKVHEGWAFSPDGKVFVHAIAADRSRVVVRDWPSRKVRRQFDLSRSGVNNLFISADNRTLSVLFQSEQTLQRYDLESGKPLPGPGETHRSGVLGVEVAPDGAVVSLGSDRVLRTWDLASGRQTRQVPLDWAPAGAPFAMSRDGNRIALANDSQSAVAIFDRAGKMVRRIDTAGQGIDRVVFSPSGQFLAGSGRQAKSARVWETAPGKMVAEFAAGKGCWWSPTVDVAFSPDERYFVATTEGKVQFWEVNRWRRVSDLPAYANGLAFSPDGRMLATAGGYETEVWEVASRKLRLKVKSKGYWNWPPRFSPDGRLLARLTGSTTAPDAVEVWDLTGGKQVAMFQGHDSPVRAVAFTNDGRRLITASDDCTLLVWDLAAGRLLGAVSGVAVREGGPGG